MKLLPVILLASLLSACSPEPKVSGKPVSYWIERLDDLDPRVQYDAIQKLQFVDGKYLNDRAYSRLQEIWKAGGGDAVMALEIYERSGRDIRSGQPKK